MARRNITTRIIRPGEKEPVDRDWLENYTMDERIDAVWTLTKLCLAWNNDGDDEPRLHRSLTRIIRPQR